MSELKGNNIIFLQELEKEKEVIPDKFYKELNASGIYYHFFSKKNHNHILDHKLVQEYLGILDGKKYHVYVTNPLLRSNGTIVVLDDFIRCAEFLDVIIGDLRCVHSTENYEMLQTPIFSRSFSVTDLYQGMRVEMEMNKKIKEKMNQDIISNGFIRDCVEKYSDEIFESIEFEKNIEYIYQYNMYMNTGITLAEVEKKYKEFIVELLSFLDDEELERYSKYLNTCSKKSASISHMIMYYQEGDYSEYISF